ncbi:MAG: DUF6901 family protein, partial [Vulcanimicrobiota bacterium]
RWTTLEYHQCPNCPLSEETHPFCPVALNLVDLIEFFKTYNSFDQVNVEVEVKERSYRKKTSLQEGISSILGIYMVTSGCPVLEKLKPMVRFHMPFASPLETTYRAVCMFLMAQFIKKSEGLEADFSLNELVEIYDEIQEVNTAFSSRLKSININDASINAVVILDCFSQFVRFSINYENLSEIKDFFHPYFP